MAESEINILVDHQTKHTHIMF